MDFEKLGKYCHWVDARLMTLLSDISDDDFTRRMDERQRSLRELSEHLIISREMFFHDLTA